jgi:GT2 family glycosyltransferase
LLESNRWPAIIIDNASTDGSADTLTKHFPQCDVVALAQNNGYGRAANIGLKKANTPFAMLLNPDLYATPMDIEKLLAHARQNKEKAAILAPAVSAKDFTGGPPQPVQWISGSAMLFNMSLMGKIGFFDEKIFLFSEETDICRRTVMAGYDILLCHDVYMEHLKGQSSGTNPEIEYMKNWHFGWSNVYYCTKHGIAKGKQSPARLARQYRLKACFATNPTKRAKYRGRADGVRAFMAGEKAFFPDGMPKASPR